MSPIIGKRAKENHAQRDGLIVWVGPIGNGYVHAVLLYDDGTMKDVNITRLTVLGPVEGPYR